MRAKNQFPPRPAECPGHILQPQMTWPEVFSASYGPDSEQPPSHGAICPPTVGSRTSLAAESLACCSALPSGPHAGRNPLPCPRGGLARSSRVGRAAPKCKEATRGCASLPSGEGAERIFALAEGPDRGAQRSPCRGRPLSLCRVCLPHPGVCADDRGPGSPWLPAAGERAVPVNHHDSSTAPT